LAKHLVLVKEVVGNRAVLAPANPFSEEMLDTLPWEKLFSVDVKEDRSRGELGFYWAGLGLLVANFDDEDKARWPTSEAFSRAMLVAFGYKRRFYRLDKSYTEEADSIALNSMEPEPFKEYFELVRAAVVRMFDYDPWDLWKVVSEEKKRKAREARAGWR
jgi:hypothetical protein